MLEATSPPMIALIAGIATALAIGLLRWLQRPTGRLDSEAEAGLAALDALNWREFAQRVADFLAARGMTRVEGDTFVTDPAMLVQRGHSRYVVDCQQGRRRPLTKEALSLLHELVKQSSAAGGLLVTNGSVSTAVRDRATASGIEIIDGAALWDEVAAHVPADLRAESRQTLGALHQRWRRETLLKVGLGGFAAAIAAFALTFWLNSPAVDSTPVASPGSGGFPTSSPLAQPSATPSAAPAPAPGVPSRAPATIDTGADLGPEAQAALAKRRREVLDTVTSMAGVSGAAWTSASTVTVQLLSLAAAGGETLAEICERFAQFEEFRVVRLELEFANGDSTRWHLCR